MTYAEWIEAYVSRQPERFVRGKCKEACAEMRLQFPELRMASGFVYCTWGRDTHVWCVTPDGKVVDPTLEQFQRVYTYEELDLSNPEDIARIPTGVCMDCGGDVYDEKTFCSDACESDTLAYLNSI